MKAAGVSSRENNNNNNYYYFFNVCKVNISASSSGMETDHGDVKVGVCGGDNIRLGPAPVQRGISFPF